MYRYKNLLVGLKLDKHDIPIIQYAAKISRMAKSDNVYFLHVLTKEEIPESIRASYPGLVIDKATEIEEQMMNLVEANFNGDEKSNIHFKIVEGKRLFTFLSYIRDYDIDVVLAGRQDNKNSETVFPERLARKAPCSVLIIPSTSEISIKKVMVACDFSEQSLDALDVAIAFAKAVGLNEVICTHIYQLPLGYYKTGKTREEFSEIMFRNAEQEFKSFIKRADLKDLSVKSIIEESNGKMASSLAQVMEREKVDLLTIGSRGRSASAAILLGSLTEHLLWTSQVPIIAVKKKGANMQLIEALLNI
ncbi:universal stress protein [candidate division KSB1 bacterium]|nr:universal stress protein [candidate division KSB1 bacterium]